MPFIKPSKGHTTSLSGVKHDLAVKAEPAEAAEDDAAVADDGANVRVRLEQESWKWPIIQH